MDRKQARVSFRPDDQPTDMCLVPRLDKRHDDQLCDASTSRAKQPLQTIQRFHIYSHPPHSTSNQASLFGIGVFMRQCDDDVESRERIFVYILCRTSNRCFLYRPSCFLASAVCLDLCVCFVCSRFMLNCKLIQIYVGLMARTWSTETNWSVCVCVYCK